MDTPEADWRFYLSEWKDYKRVTGIVGQSVLDELWSCMKGDLKRLAFDQGGKETLTTEDLMLARIKSLAVTELHTAVHTVQLHEAKQAADESTKAFAARVQGIASNCNFTKTCTCQPPTNVSFAEETVYHVVLAGLRDREMQERCLAAAYMTTVTNLPQLVQFCSAEEASKAGSANGLLGAVKSSYQRDRQAAGLAKFRPKPKACQNCNGAPHGKEGDPWWKIKNACPASNVTCAKCGKTGHFTLFCHSGTLAANLEDPVPDQSPILAAVESEPTYAFALTDEDGVYRAAAVEEKQENDSNSADDANYFAFV